MTTILRPHQSSTNWFLIIAILAAIFLVAGDIWIYNKNVNFQHLLSNRKRLTEQVNQENIFLKEKFYQLTDERNLSALAGKIGLVLIKKPEFLTIKIP